MTSPLPQSPMLKHTYCTDYWMHMGPLTRYYQIELWGSRFANHGEFCLGSGASSRVDLVLIVIIHRTWFSIGPTDQAKECLSIGPVLCQSVHQCYCCCLRCPRSSELRTTNTWHFWRRSRCCHRAPLLPQPNCLHISTILVCCALTLEEFLDWNQVQL